MTILDRNTMIEENINLVYKVTNDLKNKGYYPAVSYEDLSQDGMVGLIHAVDAYDETRGTAFSTLAYTCIERAIIKANSSSQDVLLTESEIENVCNSYVSEENHIEEMIDLDSLVFTIEETLNEQAKTKSVSKAQAGVFINMLAQGETIRDASAHAGVTTTAAYAMIRKLKENKQLIKAKICA